MKSLSALVVGIAACVLTSGTCGAAPEPGIPDLWLNVRDCGASGSEYSTTAATTKGEKTITVAEIGDFQVGQGVMLSKAAPRIVLQQIWGPRHKVAWGKPPKGKVELRGYDGSQGDWLVLVLDVAENARTFRWSEDLARTWNETVPLSGDWQPLRDGLEVRFNEHTWEKGYTVAFGARGQLVTRIEKIEGNTITLRNAPTRTATGADLRHCDDAALQEAINRGIKEKRHVFIPVGRYRLSKSLRVNKPAGLRIEGANAVDTILDISEGNGACIILIGGIEATLRNLTMVGHSGFDRRDQCGHIPMLGSSYFWGFAAKNCNAVTTSGTQRVLIENCHGRRMASECFVAAGKSRGRPDKPNPNHSQGITYLRCSAINCGRNAFNDVNVGPENTHILQCRIVDVGGCSWESASRFVRFEGNYVRNAGTVAMGNLGIYNRDDTYPDVGSGQHVIANNVFEQVTPYGGAAIRTAVGAHQVIITNNRFINFGSSAIHVAGNSDPSHYPSAHTTIQSNIFDMTEVGETSKARIAIDVSAPGTIISDNQIYVRGACDPKVTAIQLLEPARDTTVHDNLIRNCGTGLLAGRATSRVLSVLDETTFAANRRYLPLDSRLPAQCQGWRIAWVSGTRHLGFSVIEAVTGADKPETVQFKLTAPHKMKAGDSFQVLPPSMNWQIHHNTIADCRRPIVLAGYGGPNSVVQDNMLTRDAVGGVTQGIEVRGRFQLIGNRLTGFDEAGCAALSLFPDPTGKPARSQIMRNVFERCAQPVRESSKGLWAAANARGNEFTDCGAVPVQAAATAERTGRVPQVATAAPPAGRALRAPRTKKPPTVDGAIDEWPWQDETRVVPIAQTPNGDSGAVVARACAARDGEFLYVAVRIAVGKNAKLQLGTDFKTCDGVELSLRAAGPAGATHVLWGFCNGKWLPLPAGGATPAQCTTMQKVVHYAAATTPTEWTCEWRIPLAELGPDPAGQVACNIGLHITQTDAWRAWVATGGAFYEIDAAGRLLLGK